MADQRIADNFQKLIELHRKKNADYSGKGNYENFEIAATVMSWFDKPQDKVFACMIGIKLGRLATLLNSGKSAENEPVDDTFDDMTVYTQLWKYGRADVMEALGMDKPSPDPTHVTIYCTCGHVRSEHQSVCIKVGCRCKEFVNKLEMMGPSHDDRPRG